MLGSFIQPQSQTSVDFLLMRIGPPFTYDEQNLYKRLKALPLLRVQ